MLPSLCRGVVGAGEVITVAQALLAAIGAHADTVDVAAAGLQAFGRLLHVALPGELDGTPALAGSVHSMRGVLHAARASVCTL
jgi:hypothetical protein